MLISQVIQIGSTKIPVIALFLIVCLFLSTFIVWVEGRRDGFDDEKAFDLFWLTLILVLLISKTLVTVPQFKKLDLNIFGFSYIGLLIGFCLPIIILTKKWKWSVFRVLDIFSLALSVIISLFYLYYGVTAQLPNFIIAALIWLAIYFFLSKLRSLKFKSGYVFSIFVTLAGITTELFFSQYRSLIFSFSFITISLVNIYLRERRDMIKNERNDGKQIHRLSLDFLNSITNKLLNKEKVLKKQQKLLTEEDPYMNRGREVENSDSLDDAALEDTPKEIVDLKKTFAAAMLEQVRRALGMLKLGKYGLCEICGKPIDKARLKAFPQATTCIDHADKR